VPPSDLATQPSDDLNVPGFAPQASGTAEHLWGVRGSGPTDVYVASNVVIDVAPGLRASARMRALLIALPLLGTACLAHVPLHTTEHLNISWRSSYQQAADEAARLDRPVLVVMIAGEKDGPSCMGGDYLRSAALRDPQVIDVINKQFVPVWINVRTTPVPRWPFLADVLTTATVDKDGRFTDRWSRTFYVHSVIVSPDGQRLLNKGAGTVASTAHALIFEGNFSYSAIDPGEYLGMLKRALERFHSV
jgi:hypothetical protein